MQRLRRLEPHSSRQGRHSRSVRVHIGLPADSGSAASGNSATLGTPPAGLPTACPLDREAAVEADLWLAPIALTDGRVSPTAVPANPFPARRASDLGFLPLTLPDYLQLLDWTGRQLRSDKRGVISTALPPILERLKVDAVKLDHDCERFLTPVPLGCRSRREPGGGSPANGPTLAAWRSPGSPSLQLIAAARDSLDVKRHSFCWSSLSARRVVEQAIPGGSAKRH